MRLPRLLSLSWNRKPATRLPLCVVSAVAGDALTADAAGVLRECISAAEPVDYFFLNPGRFNVFFHGSAAGVAHAEVLADELRAKALHVGIAFFGVGISVGECEVLLNPKAHFAAMPVGAAVSQAMGAATQDLRRIGQVSSP